MRVTCSQASSAYSENLEITDSKHVAVSGLLMEVVMGHDRYPMALHICVRAGETRRKGAYFSYVFVPQLLSLIYARIFLYIGETPPNRFLQG